MRAIMRSHGLGAGMGRLGAVFASLALVACVGATNPYYNPAKAHHTPDGFQKPPGSPEAVSSPLRFLGYLIRRLTDFHGAEVLPPGTVMARDAAKALLVAHRGRDRVTWLGHATLLVGLDGVNILTDPNFSEHASPLPFVFKRYAPPGLVIEDLPEIHAIIISHNHYDSFDMPSLRRLAARFPVARVVVPLGLGGLVREAGFTRVTELDWYGRTRAGPVTIQATPAIHDSARGLFDKNETLWAGFVLSGRRLKVWFAGDTAPGPVFNEMRRRLGAMDVALVPIGAFAPGWLMRHKHATPEVAAELAIRMGAPIGIANHWGTFPLGDDLPAEAKARFEKTARAGFRPLVLKLGETVALRAR